MTTVPLTKKHVEKIFNHLRNDRSDLFFEHVADDVSWTVMGTHPLAGVYHSKHDFLSHTFERLGKILKDGVMLEITNLLLDGDTAAVEMKSLSTAKNGVPFNNTYCWIVRFRDSMIVEVRAYLDSALVQKLIEENEVTGL
jgi:ketosteroid isomerase-like protein